MYDCEEVTVSGAAVIQRSIAFDENKGMLLDGFVKQLPEKEIYKYVALEGDGSYVPLFVPNNYGWYHQQKNLMSNYLKYPLHGGSISSGYSRAFALSWFDAFDINYLYDTRADFSILTQGVIDKDHNRYLFDTSVPVIYLNNEIFCAKLKKYIPRHYTGGEKLVADEKNSLDNGYFYCPALTNDDIRNFETNNRNYFKICVDAKTDTELQYCMFPNSHYIYYMDGKRYEPEIDYGLAYFKMTSGQHSIEIVYRDTKQIVVYWIFTIYYALILIVSIICIIYNKIKKRNLKDE